MIQELHKIVWLAIDTIASLADLDICQHPSCPAVVAQQKRNAFKVNYLVKGSLWRSLRLQQYAT